MMLEALFSDPANYALVDPAGKAAAQRVEAAAAAHAPDRS